MSSRRSRPNAGTPRPSAPDPESVIADEDWYGREVTGRTYTRYSFVDTDWTEIRTENAVFDACVFSGVRFNASRHTGTAFTNCTFQRCTFFDTAFTDCKLVGSHFQRCEFTLLAVRGGDWSFTALPGARLARAGLDRVRLREADLTGADLTGAEVTGCDLSGSALSGCVLSGADLRGSDLSALDPRTAELAGARIDLGQAAVIAAGLGCRVE
ncbi:pentapeptide repeat-containing protein [Streptomyces fradiae]|uniref:pentapeptide repeat-containing protein n=1 Tax=Streptomyces fradiae TaxID=1906 RepID=UPI0036677066